ncbi:unnamed protein product [Owenia fusiformis]|uniref:Uncharacterized protein n=1 Tax=Owenia fusiformis TaxID=6347 RepID=A0A8J1XNQ6_OWEFU|nr:unnamed protein product [Owenia fusiformis]
MGSDSSKGASKDGNSASIGKEPERKSNIDSIGPGKPFHRPACCTRAGSVKHAPDDKPIARPTDKKKLDYDELPAHQPRMSLQSAGRLNTLIKTEDPDKSDVKSTTSNELSKAGTLPCSTRIAVVSTDPRRHTATIDSVTISSDYALPQDAMQNSDSDSDIEVFDNVNETIQWTQSPSFEPTESPVTPPSTPSENTQSTDHHPISTSSVPDVLRVAEQHVIVSEEVESIVERDDEPVVNIDDTLEQLKTIAEGLDVESKQLKTPVETVETYEESEIQIIDDQEEALPFNDTFRELHISVSNEGNDVHVNDELAHNPDDLKIDFDSNEIEARPGNRDVAKLAIDRVYGAHLSPGGTPYFFQALIDEAQPQQRAVTAKDGQKGKIKSKRRSRSKRSERCSKQNLSVDNQFDPYSCPTLSNEYRKATDDVSPSDTSIAREYCAAVASGVARPDNVSTPTLSREVARATEELVVDDNIDTEDMMLKHNSEISNEHATLSKEFRNASENSEANANINEEVLTAAELSHYEDLDASPATLQRICTNNIERANPQNISNKARLKQTTKLVDIPNVNVNIQNCDSLKVMAERALREYKSQYVFVRNVSSPKSQCSNSGQQTDVSSSGKDINKGIYDKLLDPKGTLQERIDEALRDISRAVFNLSPANTLEKNTAQKQSPHLQEKPHVTSQEPARIERVKYAYNPIFSQEVKHERVSEIKQENQSPKLGSAQLHKFSETASSKPRCPISSKVQLEPLVSAKPQVCSSPPQTFENCAKKPQPSTQYSFESRMKEWEQNNSDLKVVGQIDPEFEAAFLWNASEDIIKGKGDFLETPSNTPDIITGNIWTTDQSKRDIQRNQHAALKRTYNASESERPPPVSRMPQDQVYDLLMAAKSRVEKGDLTRSTEFVYPPESDENDDDGIVEFSITKTYTEPSPFDDPPKNESPPERMDQPYNFVNPSRQTRDVSSHRLKRDPSSALIPLTEENDNLDGPHGDVFHPSVGMSKSSGDIPVTDYVSQWLKNQPAEMETPPQYVPPNELNQPPNHRMAHSKSDSALTVQQMPSNNGELQVARDQMDGLKVQIKMLHEQMRSMGDILDTSGQKQEEPTIHKTSDKGC